MDLAIERRSLIQEENQTVETLQKDLAELQLALQTLKGQIDTITSVDIPALKVEDG